MATTATPPLLPAVGAAHDLRRTRPLESRRWVGRGRWAGRDGWTMLALAAAAVAVRLAVVQTSGGFRVTMGYDDGVYFTAVTAALHGLVPYRDFVLVHPPGIIVLAAGPVWLGHAVGLGDASTLVLSRLLMVAVGGLSAALAYLAGRRLSRVAGVVAGVLYVVWLPMIREERTLLLEPVVALGTLAGLALLPIGAGRDRDRPWQTLLAGGLGGLAIVTKLWAAVPAAVLLATLLLARRWGAAMRYGLAAATVATAILAPFAMAAGPTMWRHVVTAQAGRPPNGDRIAHRVALVIDDGLPWHGVPLLATHPQALLLAVVTVLVTALAVALRVPGARTWVALLALQLVVLLRVPTFFSGYPSFVGPVGVLVLAGGAHLAWRAAGSRGWARAALAGALAITAVALGGLAVGTRLGVPVAPAIATEAAGGRCVATDDPVLLALTDTLSRDLARGCPVPDDFTGAVYLTPHPSQGRHTDTSLRRGSPQFQQFARSYFDRADVVVLRRARVDGLTHATWAHLLVRPALRIGHARVLLAAPAGPPAAPATPARVRSTP